MSSESTDVRDEAKFQDTEPWFATFMFLDVSSVISSSEMCRLVAWMTRLWRRIVTSVREGRAA